MDHPTSTSFIVAQSPSLGLRVQGQNCSVSSKFTKQMGQMVLRQYPSILTWDHYNNPSSSCQRSPRSEMLIRGKVPYTSQDIVEYLKCSQKQFIAKTKVPQEKYKEQKNKFPIITEMDIPRKISLKGQPSEKKIFELSLRYYSQQDILLKAK